MTYDKIPENVDRLCNKLNDRNFQLESFKEVYSLSFDAHFFLVTIHPFGDGNGRTSRLLMNFIQAYHEQPLCPVYSEDEAEYIDAIRASRKAEGLDNIRKFMYGQLNKFLERELKAFQSREKGISFIF